MVKEQKVYFLSGELIWEYVPKHAMISLPLALHKASSKPSAVVILIKSLVVHSTHQNHACLPTMLAISATNPETVTKNAWSSDDVVCLLKKVRCSLSDRAVKVRERAILVTVIMFVLALLSLPSVLRFVKDRQVI